MSHLSWLPPATPTGTQEGVLEDLLPSVVAVEPILTGLSTDNLDFDFLKFAWRG